MDAPLAAPPPGTVLAGKYRVERVLGRGGMGFVVHATQLPIDEPVALKFLHPHLARDPDLVLRFEREAKAARKIKSEHVVRILDVGTLESGAPYMVMEYLEGSDLDALVQRTGRLGLSNAVDYLLQAMEALAEAHVQGMVHRDLKPANLFVARRADGSPLVKVLDFGISKVTGQGGADLGTTKTGAQVLGSPLYMAPEQMRSLRGVDARTDIWALGIILYEMLVARPPFTGPTMTELCAMILQDAPPSLRIDRPDLPPAVEAIIFRCLEKDPNARYPHVGVLAQALAAFASPAGRFSAERILGVMQTVGATFSAPPPVQRASGPQPLHGTTSPSSWGQHTQAPTVVRPSPPNRAMLAGIGVLASLFIAALVWIGWSLQQRRVTEIHYLSPDKEEKSEKKAEPEPDLAPRKGKDDKPAAEVVRFAPVGGNYGKPFELTLTTRTPNATIYYTIDGTTPTTKSAVYNKPFTVDKSGSVHAIAVSATTKPSWEKFQVYVFFPNAIESPPSVDFGAWPCGATPKPQTFTIKNHGPATTVHAEMSLGGGSPFMVSGDGPFPANGEAKILVTPKPMNFGFESLDGVADTVDLQLGSGLHRSVSVTEIATGPAFEVIDDGQITFDETSEHKASKPESIRIRSRGTMDTVVSLTTTGMGVYSAAPTTLVIPVGEIRAASVVFTPSSSLDFYGTVNVSHPAGHPGCSLPVVVPLRGQGIK